MQITFKPNSIEAINGKWVSRFTTIKYINNGQKTEHQQNSLGKEFDTKEEADNYAIEYCLAQNYIADK